MEIYPRRMALRRVELAEERGTPNFRQGVLLCRMLESARITI